MRGEPGRLPEAANEVVLRETRLLREIVERRRLAEAAAQSLHGAPDAGVIAAADPPGSSGLRAAKNELGGCFGEGLLDGAGVVRRMDDGGETRQEVRVPARVEMGRLPPESARHAELR